MPDVRMSPSVAAVYIASHNRVTSEEAISLPSGPRMARVSVKLVPCSTVRNSIAVASHDTRYGTWYVLSMSVLRAGFPRLL